VGFATEFKAFGESETDKETMDAILGIGMQVGAAIALIPLPPAAQILGGTLVLGASIGRLWTKADTDGEKNLKEI